MRMCVSPPPVQLSPVEETSTQREWEPGTPASQAVKGSGEPGGGRKEGKREEKEGRRVEGGKREEKKGRRVEGGGRRVEGEGGRTART